MKFLFLLIVKGQLKALQISESKTAEGKRSWTISVLEASLEALKDSVEGGVKVIAHASQKWEVREALGMKRLHISYAISGHWPEKPKTPIVHAAHAADGWLRKKSAEKAAKKAASE